MTTLTLSAVLHDRQDGYGIADNVAARFEDLLELRSRAAARGYHDLHEQYTERIVSELISDAFGLAGPGGHAA